MESIENIAAYKTIPAQETEKDKYLYKDELTYTFKSSLLPEIVEATKGYYSLLTHDEKIFRTFKLLYFDTPKNRFYIDAHNGKRNRYIVRFKQCIESKSTFFEVKYMNKKGRKRKKKIRVSAIKNTLGEDELNLLKKVMRKKKAYKLEPKLTCVFKRFTLKAKQTNERIFVDYDMQFNFNNSEPHDLDLVLAKIIQERFDGDSKFIAELRESGIRQGQIGNYALGMSIFGNQKSNIFKDKKHRINKLIENYD